MRQEINNQKNREEREKISNSRAMGIIVLIGLLLVFQIITFIFHKVKEFYPDKNLTKKEKIVNEKLFNFNPNTITQDSLVLLGFSVKQAKSVINYRDKGGKFYKVEDFSKLYVVDSSMYERLKSYIVFPDKKTNNKRIKEHKKIIKKEKIDVVKTPIQNLTKNKVVAESIYGKKSDSNMFKCNINLADSSDFVKLYGIGPYFAKKILKYRERLGGSFVDIMQILEVEGIDLDRFNNIKEKLFVDEVDFKKFSLWEVDKDFLEKHPYIGTYNARGIIVFLKINQELKNKSGEELLKIMEREKVINKEMALKLEMYMK